MKPPLVHFEVRGLEMLQRVVDAMNRLAAAFAKVAGAKGGLLEQMRAFAWVANRRLRLRAWSEFWNLLDGADTARRRKEQRKRWLAGRGGRRWR